jgi:hypothetical protein
VPYRHPILISARLALSLVLFTACGSPSEPIREPYAPAQKLTGSWRWVSSLDVRTGQRHTPATAGFEATISFTADSALAGAFVYARTGQGPITGRFSIDFEDSPGADFVVLEPSIDFLSRNAWVAAGRDTLYLGGVMELGFNSLYARVAQ